MHRRFLLSIVAAVLGLGVQAWADEAVSPSVRIEVDPLQATVGDRLSTRVIVELPEEVGLEPTTLGPELGAFAVIGGSWSGPEVTEEGERWIWTGELVSFRTGELEIPSIDIRIEGADGVTRKASTEPVGVEIRSVLDPAEGEEEDPSLADIKPPAGIAADYAPVMTAAGIVTALLLGAGVLWWLQRRFASRLAPVEVPDDPFQRVPPHEWVYSELQKLLARRLAEQGQVELFFAELSVILKRYLSGRYRTELMEQTTDEVPERLRQAGAPHASIHEILELLRRCDRVKFARELPDSSECRRVIDEAYGIVDDTKPQTAPAAEPSRGAA